MTGKRFASCIMCFALTAALFSVSRGWASENEMNLTEEMTSAQIEDFPIIYQMPELPTGCEITALTMAVNYYGYPADKTVMASEYLPTASANRYYGADGRLYGTDMNEYFIGDPFTEGGIICGTGAIVTAADGYLADTGSALRAYDITGSSPEELYRRVRNGQPVVVWVTISDDLHGGPARRAGVVYRKRRLCGLEHE